MGTLQENQSLNAEYERNKKEREMQENIEYLNFCNEQLEKSKKNLNYKIEKLEADYKTTCDQKNKYINSLEQGLNNAEQEIERLGQTLRDIKQYIVTNYETHWQSDMLIEIKNKINMAIRGNKNE